MFFKLQHNAKIYLMGKRKIVRIVT